MSDKSAIEWTDATWNPTTGCTRVSEGCRHCYIETTPPFRIKGIKFLKAGEPSEEIGSATGVTLHPDRLDQPLKWRKPRRVFVNSLSDLFHDDVPADFLADVFATMALARTHTFQVLTKRPRRMAHLVASPDFRELVRVRYEDRGHYGEGNLWSLEPWPLPNVWLGTSVEDQKAAELRIPLLLETPAAVRFLSCEPLLGPVELVGGYYNYLGNEETGEPAWKVEPDHAPGCNCGDGMGDSPTCPIPVQVKTPRVDWVIAGGESGPKARPMNPEWVRSLRDQCVAAGVPFFFKQWGNWAPTLRVLVPEDVSWVRADQHPPMKNVGKKNAGRLLNGRTWDEFPEVVPA